MNTDQQDVKISKLIRFILNTGLNQRAVFCKLLENNSMLYVTFIQAFLSCDINVGSLFVKLSSI